MHDIFKQSARHKAIPLKQVFNSAKIPKMKPILFSLLLYYSALSPNVILAHLQSDHRCSHVPPTPEQVHYVWLSEAANFSREEEPTTDSNAGFTIFDESQRINPVKSKRHIESYRRSDMVSLLEPDNIQDSIWNLFKRFDRPITLPHSLDDLVPMKIQVYYDSSVYLLDNRRQELIRETVIPTVVNFFENVLSIRREYTIDRFRISRRCPNNTIYYAKDIIGFSRPYCMERCEDHAICGEMIVPREHLSACSYCNTTSRRCTTNPTTEGKGVANTQLLLYVSAKQTVRCKKDQTIAYAAHCAQDTKTDRPVAGHANLCPASISTDPKDLKALIATVKHELTHVLGFSVSLFAYYRDEYGRPLTERETAPGPIPVDAKTGYAKWSDKVIKRYVRRGWVTGEGPIDKEVHLIVTPTVVREVRRHFNCSTLEGAELEDQGSDGTSMTHWEKRLFENEAMTGTHTQNSVYSRITLAVLQDTGWYVANFSRAEKLEWGRDLGCDFAKKSCKSWIDDRRAKMMAIRPFCDRIKGDLLQIACTEDRSSKAVCNMRYYNEPLPSLYQNFGQLDGVAEQDLAHYGGSVDLADYCPFIQEFTWQAQNVTVRGSRCDLGGTSLESEKNAALEHYGPEARCFEHGRRWEQRSCIYKRHWHHYGAGCYKYVCSNGHINVIVGNHSYPCYYTDQLIHVEQIVDQWLYNGTLLCPACDKVCPAHKCKSYDKRLIDKILGYAQDPSLANRSKNNDDILQSILDEAFNLVDTKSDSRTNAKSARHGSISSEIANQSIESLDTKDYLKHKENLLHIFRHHESPPRHMLLCSNVIGSNRYQFLTVLISLTSTIILILIN